jgi:hypothetical protein
MITFQEELMKFSKLPFYLLIVLIGFVGWWTPATANGAPVKIFLNYLPELSNYGSTTASGVAQVSVGEAWVDIQAEGLSQLDGVEYEAWLVTADTNQMISLGKFNSDVDGNVDYYAEFDDIPLLEYRFFVISVEDVPDADLQTADSRRTIAGVFPNARLEVVSGTPTPTLGPGITPTPGAPAGLPVTGNVNTTALAAIVWLGFGLALLALGLALKRRSV